MGGTNKAGIVSYHEYAAGWLDSSIQDFLGVIPPTSESAAYALVTCLDSDPGAGILVENDAGLRAALNGATRLGDGFVVQTKLLLKDSVRAKLFVGFDEVWFFPTAPIEPKPQSISIVGPHRIDQAMLDKLGRWLGANGCSLGLGDGAGLNVIVKAHGLMKFVVAQSLFQPEPTFQMSKLWVQDEEKAVVSSSHVLAAKPAPTPRKRQPTGRK